MPELAVDLSLDGATDVAIAVIFVECVIKLDIVATLARRRINDAANHARWALYRLGEGPFAG